MILMFYFHEMRQLLVMLIEMQALGAKTWSDGKSMIENLGEPTKNEPIHKLLSLVRGYSSHFPSSKWSHPQLHGQCNWEVML